MNQPMGRLEALQYREASFYMEDGRVGTADVFRVHFRAPDGEYYYHDLPNDRWDTDNGALQFMALWGYQPTALDGTMHNAHPDKIIVPIAPIEDDWKLAQAAMEGGEKALERVEWFDPSLGANGDSGPPDDPNGGGNDGDGGGVSAKVADEDSDVGIEVVVG